MEFHVFTNFGVQILKPQAVFKPSEKSLGEGIRDLWQQMVLVGAVSLSCQLRYRDELGLDYLIDPQGGYVELGAGG
jgi:hypothetical protein